MASERQRLANARNGRLGGPKTEAGKQISRSNSVKHGLTSSTLVVLRGEDAGEYEQVLEGFRNSLKPIDAMEDALVLRLAQAHWRSLRARRIETGMLSVTATHQCNAARREVENCPDQLDPYKAIGVGFLVMPPSQWQSYLRYDASIARDFFRTLDTLTRLQRERRKLAAETPAPPPEPEPVIAGKPVKTFTATSGAPVSENGIRSVSQNRPAANIRILPRTAAPRPGNTETTTGAPA